MDDGDGDPRRQRRRDLPAGLRLLLYRILPGGPWLKGATWGFVLWLIAESVVVPIAGGGLFHAAMGVATTAAASLMGHLVYGALLGGIAGEARSAAPYERPGQVTA